ncbi:MAG: RimK family alpha-L-glutamate ligase [Candidatus Aenigmatarchaeota archaeon]
MTKICILGPSKRGQEEVWLIEEAQKLFDKVAYVPIASTRVVSIAKGVDVLYKNTSLSEFDAILPRIPRTRKNYGYVVSKILAGKTLIPFKPESVFITHNKFLTLVALDRAKIPIPKTYLASTRKALERLLDKIEYPIVIKLLYGSLGTGVMFAETKQSAVPLMDTIEGLKEPVFVEEFIKNPGEDIRVLVIGDEVAAAMKRIAQHGDRRTNIGAGGSGKKIKLSAEMESLAISTAKALKLGIAGIDIIEGKDGPVVIEANINAHFSEITRVTGINVAQRMVQYMKDKLDARKKVLTGGFWDLVEGY